MVKEYCITTSACYKVSVEGKDSESCDNKFMFMINSHEDFIKVIDSNNPSKFMMINKRSIKSISSV